MTFASAEVAGTVVLSFLLYLALPASRRAPFLAILSCALYAWVSPVGTFLAVASGAVAHRLAVFAGRATSDRAKRLLVGAGVVLVLGNLVAWKALDVSTGTEGIRRVVVPLGLSYFSFKIVSHLLDVLWERSAPEPSLLAFLSYVMFFPQLTAGPIQRATDFLPQVRREIAVDPVGATEGLRLILFGAFKKMVVADRLAAVIDPVYADAGGAAGLPALVAFLAFPVQLYADFSALTDIARGLGRLFGIRSPANFRNPFYAATPQEFWRRWHMTLTGWLADYLFTPLQLALRSSGRAGTVLAILINMSAVGIWHGFRPTYLAFGLLNGVFLSVTVLAWPSGRRPRTRLASVAGAVSTYVAVASSFVFFRASSVAQGARVLAAATAPFEGLGTATYADPRAWRDLGWTAIAVAAMEAVHLGAEDEAAARGFLSAPAAARWAAYYAVVLSILLLGVWSAPVFLYQQF